MKLFIFFIYSFALILVGYHIGKKARKDSLPKLKEEHHINKQEFHETTDWTDVDIDNIFEQKCPSKILNWEEFKIKILKNNSIYEVVPDNFGPLDLDYLLVEKVYLKKFKRHIFLNLEIAAKTTEADFIRIIEVGSFKGLSTSLIGEACHNITQIYGKTCQIISVDTWTGSAEFYEFVGLDTPKNEYAYNLFLSYLNNMKLKGLNNIVYPLRLPSSAAAHIFHCYKIQADVAYIDADHDYNAVVRNIQLYYPLVRKEGILMGHNFTLKGSYSAWARFWARQVGLARSTYLAQAKYEPENKSFMLPFLNSSRMLSSITEHVNCANEDPYLIYYYSL